MTSEQLITIIMFTSQILFKRGTLAYVRSSQSEMSIRNRKSRCWCCHVCCQKAWSSLTALTRVCEEFTSMKINPVSNIVQLTVISALSKEEFMTGQWGGWALTFHFHYSLHFQCENKCPGLLQIIHLTSSAFRNYFSCDIQPTWHVVTSNALLCSFINT